ncbi:MAG: uL15 family ribosomal protein [Candidatus Pacebacteria bacterium]|nr:uL15 family ribosomal protein [Candidatus Paceibacterota bacterium]
MQLHQIKRKNKNKESKRVGRGGARGKTSGKGMKGQNSRAGNSNRPALRDSIKKIPKLRGQGIHGNKNKEIINKCFAINLKDLEKVYKDGDIVNQESLLKNNLVKKRHEKIPKIKILGYGDINKKIIIENLFISSSAKLKIEKAGGELK